jgi:hypothetical protein
MKPLLAATAAVALMAAAPAFAADTDVNANATGGKPSTGTDTGTNPTAKNEKASSSTGASTGMSGSAPASKQLPGASDSTKPDSSLSSEGNKMKQ